MAVVLAMVLLVNVITREEEGECRRFKEHATSAESMDTRLQSVGEEEDTSNSSSSSARVSEPSNPSYSRPTEHVFTVCP